MGNAACCGDPVRANDHKAYLQRVSSIAAGTGALQSARLHSNRAHSGRNSARNPARNLSTRKVKPNRNLLVIALVAGFKDALREKFKSSEEAFEKIGGDDDDNIDTAELNEFLIGIGYSNSNLNAQIFQYLDKDKDGYISKAEFVALCTGHDEHVADFKERLLAKFETVKGAFQKLDTSFDHLIDYNEFQEFCTNNLGYTDLHLVKRIFEAIDDDHNAVISKPEFKALFDTSGEFGLVAEFKETIKAKFKSTMEAFEKLGGNDDGVIDRGEFQDILDDLLGYTKRELVDQLFNVIDDNHDGYISKNEFRALFFPQSLQLMEFRESMRKKYKTRNVAFEMLGGKDSRQICPQKFHESCARDFGLKDARKNEQLFRMIDCDGDAAISRDEFKKFFLFSHTYGVGNSGLGKQPIAFLIQDEHPFEQEYNAEQTSGFGNKPAASLIEDETSSDQQLDAEQTSAPVPDAEATSDASLDDVQDASNDPLLELKPATDYILADAELSCGTLTHEVELTSGISINVDPAAVAQRQKALKLFA